MSADPKPPSLESNKRGRADSAEDEDVLVEDGKSKKAKHQDASHFRGPAQDSDNRTHRLELFKAYYQKQGVIGSDSEWEELRTCLLTSLPVVVRVNKTRRTASSLAECLETKGFSVVPWFPGRLAWQMKDEDFVKDVKAWCGIYAKSYQLRFQEAVSLLPPLFLNLQEAKYFIDLCAAPGSKTLEAIELMGGKGCIIANEMDGKRCNNFLTPNVKAMHSPACAVTTSSGQRFPALYDDDGTRIYFDSVLCDVPCSGDGTIRKIPGSLNGFDVRYGMSLHGTQLRILMNGLNMLRVGGTLVYSTCSFNPIENEAVVATALTRLKGSVELVDTHPAASSMGVKVRRGLVTWVVPEVATHKGKYTTTDIKYHTQTDTYPEVKMQPPWHCRKTMFPEVADAEARASLKRCARLVPHDNDSGGFFVAVFRKTLEIHDTEVAPLAKDTAGPVRAPRDDPSRARGVYPEVLDEGSTRCGWRGRNSKNRYIHRAQAPASLTEMFGLGDATKHHLHYLHEINVHGDESGICAVTDELKRFMMARTNPMYPPEYCRVVRAGVGVFKKSEGKDQSVSGGSGPRFRPSSDGIATIAPLVSKRILTVADATYNDLVSCATIEGSRVDSLIAMGDLDGMTCSNTFRFGPVIVVPKASDGTPDHARALTCVYDKRGIACRMPADMIPVPPKV